MILIKSKRGYRRPESLELCALWALLSPAVLAPAYAFGHMPEPIVRKLLIDHPMLALCGFVLALSLMVALFVRFALLIKAFLKDECSGPWSSLIGTVVAIIVLACFMQVRTDMSNAARKISEDGQLLHERIEFALEAWSIVWLVLMAYIAKYSWDHTILKFAD